MIKILMAIDSGVGDFAGKKLKDIVLDDVPFNGKIFLRFIPEQYAL